MQYTSASTDKICFSWEAFTCKSQIGFREKHSSFSNIFEPPYRIVERSVSLLLICSIIKIDVLS